MRLGFISSAFGHAAILLVALLVLATPRQIGQAPTKLMAVDLVPEQEIGETAKDAPKIDLPRDAPADKAAPDAPAQPNPRDTQGLALAATSPQEAQQRTEEPDPFAPGATPKPLFFPTLTPGLEGLSADFDAPAETGARLSRDEVAALRAQVQKCWKAPTRLAQTQNIRAVLRIALNVDGVLTAEPILVKASASSLGPPLVQSAMRALRQCQPYGFLPAEKYDEWKVLELTFSPQGLSAN